MSLRFNFTVCHPGGSPQGDDRVYYLTTLRSSSVILRKSATFMLPLGTPAESFPLASVMSARKRSAATLGLGGNLLPYAYAQKT